ALGDPDEPACAGAAQQALSCSAAMKPRLPLRVMHFRAGVCARSDSRRGNLAGVSEYVTKPTSGDPFKLLVQSIVDYAIYMLDPNGFVTSWNAGAERIKGFKAEEVIGKHFSTFYAEEDR